MERGPLARYRAGSAQHARTGAAMSEQDRGEEATAPGNWRVTAQPYSARLIPAAVRAASGEPGVPAKSGGHPLIGTLACLAVLGMALAGQGSTPVESDGGASDAGYVVGGALFGLILWAIAFAITIRKASTRWKLGSLILVMLLGALVALVDLVGAPRAPPNQVPVVRAGK
jgi:hypothetical protein